MKVKDFAKNLGTSSDVVIELLKHLKLKAKDEEQELNAVVLSILKAEFPKIRNSMEDKVSKRKKMRELDSLRKEKEKEEKKLLEKGSKKKSSKNSKKEKIITKMEDAKKLKINKKKNEKSHDDEKTIKKTVQLIVKKKEEQKENHKDEKKTNIKKELAEEIKKKNIRKKNIKKDENQKVLQKSAKDQESIDVKKNIAEKGYSKTPPKRMTSPLITLKPLLRKKKKFSHKDEDRKNNVAGSIDISDISEDFKKDLNPILSAERQSMIDSGKPLPEIEIQAPISVKDFSIKIQEKPSVVLKQLMKRGVFAHINQSLDLDVVKMLTNDFGFSLSKVRTQEEQIVEMHNQEEDNPKLLVRRAPVITFMGHVDHGKTTLIDKIRSSKVADKEHGGITQHTSAYSVDISNGRITFLDTPGHEAFTAMRSRGAHITDIIVLVIAADEGVMPQTKEAIDHARAAGVSIVVALNKIDKRNADIDRVKKQLSEEDLEPEDWGGKTVVVGVSAVTGEGVDDLLELILLEAEMLELKANPNKLASGIVVEANLSRSKGSISTLIVQKGTLKEGDFIIVGPYYGKIKAMFDDHGRIIKEAGPSMPVEVTGLSDVPDAGEMFYVVSDEKQARTISMKRQEQIKNKRLKNSNKITLEDLYSRMQEGTVKELNVILKADVQGSLEALKDSLEKIPSDKVKIKFIHSAVGDVNASDVILAVASEAIIIAFHVSIGPRAKKELEKQYVDVRQYRIIYDAVNDIKNALEGLLEAKTFKKFQSRIEIREVFKLSKQGIVAGCYVTKGKVARKANIDVIRNDEIIFSGIISSLKRFKDDVKEVTEGMECGITIAKFDKIQAGDIIEAYEIEKVAQKL